MRCGTRRPRSCSAIRSGSREFSNVRDCRRRKTRCGTRVDRDAGRDRLCRRHRSRRCHSRRCNRSRRGRVHLLYVRYDRLSQRRPADASRLYREPDEPDVRRPGFDAGARRATGVKPDPAAPPPTPMSLLTTPLFHVTANNCGAYATTAAGGKMVFMYRWDAGEALKIIERERVTASAACPSWRAN